MTVPAKGFLAVAVLLGLGACAETPEMSWAGGGRVNSAGPAQLVTPSTETFTAARLAIMVERATDPGVEPGSPNADADGPAAQARLDRALANFANRPYATDRSADTAWQIREQNRLRDARNQIQDQLIAESNNRCNVYKSYLRRISTSVGFGLGGLATAAGAAGAIVTGGASQVLSGAASALSGINAEFQKDFFNGLVTAVIIPGIDRQRSDLRNSIVANSCSGVSEYPLTLAISEAIRYHGACSADVGIAASGQAIARTSPDSLSTVLNAAEQIRRINSAFTTLTNADARKLIGQAAADATAAANLKSMLDAATAALQNAQQPGSSADTAALQKKADSLRAAYNAASVKAAKSAAIAANLGNDRVSAASSSPGSDPTVWKDPNANVPLVGANTTIVACKVLDANGK